MFIIAALLACETSSSQETTELWTTLVIQVGEEGQPVSPTSLVFARGELLTETRTVQRDGDSEVTDSFTESGPWTPVIVDPEGQEVDLFLAPHASLYEPYVEEQPFERVHQALTGFAPGDYTITALDSEAGRWELDTPYTFQVQAPAQDTATLAVGDVFLVDTYHTAYVGDLLHEQGSSWIRVQDIDGDQVQVQLVIERDDQCVAVNAWALAQDGELSWVQDKLSVPQGDAELVAHGVRVTLPLSQDGLRILGGQAIFTVQAQGVDAMLDQVEGLDSTSCELLPSFGIDCAPCLEGPGECRTLFLADLSATKLPPELAAAFDPELPICGVDLSDVQAPVIDLSGLNLDCGCTTAAGFSSASLGWLALALLRFRRRKRKHTAKC